MNRSVGLVVMEACGSAHHWARHLQRQGIEVRLLPRWYVRPYVKRNNDIQSVRIKSVEQQYTKG